MVIHAESFDPAMMELVRFSVSTKIAESLMYGPCLLAYGPEGIASIDYLKENDAAYVITQTDRLAEGLTEILSNAKLREQIMGNARALLLEIMTRRSIRKSFINGWNGLLAATIKRGKLWMKVLQVNTVCGRGSTGRIVTDLLFCLKENGHSEKIAYGLKPMLNAVPNDTILMESRVEYCVHNILSRFTDNEGGYSFLEQNA